MGGGGSRPMGGVEVSDRSGIPGGKSRGRCGSRSAGLAKHRPRRDQTVSGNRSSVVRSARGPLARSPPWPGLTAALSEVRPKTLGIRWR
jgi:hypothetical protein